jgi:hypothetical protein
LTLQCGLCRNQRTRKHVAFALTLLTITAPSIAATLVSYKLSTKPISQRWKNGLETGVTGAAGISRYVRRYMIEKYGERCQLCDWQERNPVTGKVPLTIDHTDGNCLNNAEVNLRLLVSELSLTYPDLRQFE